MSLAHALDHHVGLPTIPNITPIVFVVDDDIRVRDSLELLIHRQGWQLETFESAQDFFSRPKTLVPSCLILALSHSDLTGLEVQKQIARERPEMPIIVSEMFQPR